jgi:hypothetical protein
MSVGEEFDHQNSYFFYVKWFHMMRGVNIKCFFTSKTPKNHILVQKVFFFVLSGFWILGRLFMFL